MIINRSCYKVIFGSNRSIYTRAMFTIAVAMQIECFFCQERGSWAEANLELNISLALLYLFSVQKVSCEDVRGV